MPHHAHRVDAVGMRGHARAWRGKRACARMQQRTRPWMNACAHERRKRRLLDPAYVGGATLLGRAQGEKHAVVYATGASTFFGRAAALISGVHNVANIQKARARIMLMT